MASRDERAWLPGCCMSALQYRATSVQLPVPIWLTVVCNVVDSVATHVERNIQDISRWNTFIYLSSAALVKGFRVECDKDGTEIYVGDWVNITEESKRKRLTRRCGLQCMSQGGEKLLELDLGRRLD